MIFKDYYKILGLETNRVTMSQIKVAYREQAKKYHPDVNISSKKNEEIFKDVNEAYRVLSNQSSKRKYDRMWNYHVGRAKKNMSYEESKRSKGSVFSDFFKMFFGAELDNEEEVVQDKKMSRRGENIETEINISIEDAFRGKEQTIGLRTVEGKLKKFTAKVPAGIQNNEKIRLVGQGKPGVHGGKNGDLFIKINIENTKKYRLHGCDIYTDLFITPWEAALGARVSINTIDDSSNIYIPQGIVSGEKIRIPQKGYKNSNGERGNLVAQIKIVVPEKLTKEETEMFKRLKEISKFNPRRV